MTNTHKNKCLISAVSVTLSLCITLFMLCVFTLDGFAQGINTLSTTASLNLRSSASTSASVLVTMPQGASVTLLQKSTNGWAKVSYSSYTGYCSTAYLEPASDSGITMKGKTTDDVNLRSGKGTSYSVLTVVPSATTVSVLSNADEDWAKVTYSGKTGYVSKDYITITFALATVETTDSTTAPTIVDTPEFTYPDPDIANLPHWYDYSLTDSLIQGEDIIAQRLMLDKSELSLDIGSKHNLVAFLPDKEVGSACVSYTSSDESVASVTDSGIVTGKSSGKATITAKNLISGGVAVCNVSVSTVVAPTEPVTEPVTSAPTNPPTAAPTDPPTNPPTAAPTSAPTQTPTTEQNLSLSAKSATIYIGNQFLLKATGSTAVTWSTSDSSVATVSGGLVTAKAAGKATITAKTSSKSVSCTITVKKATASVSVSHSKATITAGKTFLAYSSTDSVSWSSGDTSVATVKNGYIYGVSAGQAIIKVSKSGGAVTMLVTVEPAAPIRFAYTSPNCAVKNGEVTLIAITDTTRTDVKFEVTVGSEKRTIEATSKSADGSNILWKGKTSFDTAGTYSVKAYSKNNGKWSTCSDAATTAFVTDTTDKNTTVCAKRRASDEIINLIANYEGFIGSVYADPLTGDPTLGYGRVVYSGQQFYNNLTKTEAYAYLVQTVNNDGYATKVNNFLVDNSVKFNQQQFDALVCFVYNTGTGVLSNDSELRNALLNCDSGSSTSKKTYYINGSGVRIRKGPSTSDDIIKELDYGTELKILEKTSSAWYYVQLNDGTKGYVYTDYIASKVSSGSLDLNFVNKQNLINKFCQYHHANGCVYGLLYRRVDEMEVFFYNDYDRNYGSYKYDIKFTCANNSGFHT